MTLKPNIRSISFLNMPLEIRNIIYDFLFEHDPINLIPHFTGPCLKHLQCRPTSEQLQPLLCCKQIYAECCAITYANTVFHISAVDMAHADEISSRLLERLKYVRSEKRQLVRYATFSPLPSHRMLNLHAWENVIPNLSRPTIHPKTASLECLPLPSLEVMTFYSSSFQIYLEKVLHRLPMAFSKLQKLVLVVDECYACRANNCTGCSFLDITDPSVRCALTVEELNRIKDCQQETFDSDREQLNYNLQQQLMLTAPYAAKERYNNVHHLKTLDSEFKVGCVGILQASKDSTGERHVRHVHVLNGGEEELKSVIRKVWTNSCADGLGEVILPKRYS